MSMLVDYYKEECGHDVKVFPFGFLAYKAKGPELFIADAFVRQSHRGRGHSKELIQHAEEVGRECGCKYLSCNTFVNGSWERFNEKVKIFHRVGLNISGVGPEHLQFIKYIQEV